MIQRPKLRLVLIVLFYVLSLFSHNAKHLVSDSFFVGIAGVFHDSSHHLAEPTASIPNYSGKPKQDSDSNLPQDDCTICSLLGFAGLGLVGLSQAIQFQSFFHFAFFNSKYLIQHPLDLSHYWDSLARAPPQSF